MKKLITEQEILKRIKDLALQIDKFYSPDEELIVLVVLNGAMLFGADLVRELTLPCKLDTLSVSSYLGQSSSNQINFRAEPKLDLSGANILLVDDILDTGLTMQKIMEYLYEKGAKSVESCCLLNKLDIPKKCSEIPKWIGFDIPNLFVIGYGLDEDEKFRNLRDIYQKI